MPKRLGFLFISLLVVFITLVGVTACGDDDPTPPTDEYGVVAGLVSAPDRSALADVTVRIGTKTTLTDTQGRFIISGVTPGAAVLVDFAKAGYIGNQKIVHVQKGKTIYTSSTLFVGVTATFSATEMGNIVDGNAFINIPANSFVTSQGAAFTGNVLAEMKFFDPTDAACLDAFPGDFSGIQTNGTETMFESYGFIAASFYDAANPTSELQLAAGSTAQIVAMIPASLQANAPETIPMWYYDEALGKWKQQGTASKQNTSYVGNVSHFTYWNFDHPIQITDQSTLTGKVVMSGTNDPVAGAQVVATGVNYSGYTRAYSDTQGNFTLTVKASAQVTVRAVAGENMSPMSAVITTPASGASAEIDDLVITDLTFTVIGKLVDPDGNPVSPGYGQVYQINPPAGASFSAWLTIDATGDFEINTINPATDDRFDIQFRYTTRGTVFSAPIDFIVPLPGQIRDLGNVTMRPGGTLTGRAKDNQGNWFTDKSISFAAEGASGEGSMLHAQTDAQGNFSLVGPFSTNLTNIKASTWIEGAQYSSPTMTLHFPASGATGSLGTITLSPAK